MVGVSIDLFQCCANVLGQFFAEYALKYKDSYLDAIYHSSVCISCPSRRDRDHCALS